MQPAEHRLPHVRVERGLHPPDLAASGDGPRLGLVRVRRQVQREHDPAGRQPAADQIGQRVGRLARQQRSHQRTQRVPFLA